MKYICTQFILLTFIISCTGGPAAIHTEGEEVWPFRSSQLVSPLPAYSGHFLNNPKEDTVLNTGSYIRNLLIDKSGNLWFTTHSSGFGVFDGRKQYIFENKAGINGNVVRDIKEDISGNIWIATNGGLYRYAAKSPLHLPESYTNFTTKEGLINDQLWCLAFDQQGILWIGTEKGVCKFNGKKFTAFPLPDKFAADLTNAYPAPDMITALYADKQGAMWIGTNGGGAFRYIPKNNNTACLENTCHHNRNNSGDQLIHRRSLAACFTHFSDKEGLCNNFIQSITGDKRGNVWFGTRFGGASKFDGKSFIHFNTSNGLTNNFIWTVNEDSQGNMWFATAGGGAIKYDGQTMDAFTSEDGLADDYIQSIAEDQFGNIWFGTAIGITRYDGNKNTSLSKPLLLKSADKKKHMKTFSALRNGC